MLLQVFLVISITFSSSTVCYYYCSISSHSPSIWLTHSMSPDGFETILATSTLVHRFAGLYKFLSTSLKKFLPIAESLSVFSPFFSVSLALKTSRVFRNQFHQKWTAANHERNTSEINPASFTQNCSAEFHHYKYHYFLILSCEPQIF